MLSLQDTTDSCPADSQSSNRSVLWRKRQLKGNFMSKDYDFSNTFNSGKYEIGVDDQALYGYFEHEDYGDNSGGGLWFERTEDGRIQLTDYDGTFALPKDVCDGLRLNSYVVSKDFE